MNDTERLAAVEQRIAQLEGRIEQLTAQLAALRQPAVVATREPAHPWVTPGWYRPIAEWVRTVTR